MDVGECRGALKLVKRFFEISEDELIDHMCTQHPYIGASSHSLLSLALSSGVGADNNCTLLASCFGLCFTRHIHCSK